MDEPKNEVFGIVFENRGVRIVAKASKECEGETDYHAYAIDKDDFGFVYWKWVGKSGVDARGHRFAQQGRR